MTELKQFVRLGYTVPEVLQIATRTNAQVLDMGDKLDTLEPGKLADITVVSGKPDVALDDPANVSLVIRYIEVDQGHIALPRHMPLAMPTSSERDRAP